MKYKSKSLWRSAVSIALVLTLVLGTATTAFAASNSSGAGESIPERTEDVTKYVSFGDSMTNGYGLDGYEYEYHKNDAQKTECTDPTCEKDHDVYRWANGYLQEAPASYPVKLADTYGWDLTQLAVSAMRMEDLNWILNLDYEDSKAIKSAQGEWNKAEWSETFSAGDYYTWNEFATGRFANNAAYPGATLKEIAENFQTSMKEADVISIGSGNSNFGVFLLGRIMKAIGFDTNKDHEDITDLDYAIRKLDKETQAEIKEVYTEIESEIAAKTDSDETVKAMTDAIVYTMVSYILNYEEVLETILTENPDAEIIVVGLMNTMNGMSFEYEGVTYDLGEYMYTGLSVINAYLAGLPAALQTQGKYPEATIYYAEASNVDVMVNNYSKEIYENNNTIVRDRFITEIVGENGNGMVWQLMDGMVSGMMPGADLVPVNLEMIQAYEAMDDVEKAQYAAGNTNEAISIALYLAFEKAICDSSSGATLSLEGLMALSNLSGDVFADVVKYFEENISDDSAAYSDAAINTVALIAADKDSRITSEVITAIVTDGEKAVAEQLVSRELPGTVVDNDSGTTVKEILTQSELTLDAFLLDGKNNQLKDDKLKNIYGQYISNVETVSEQLAAFKIKDNVSMLCMLLALPDTLSDALKSDDNIFGLLNLFGRCLIGNGLGAHPSAAGHQDLYDAIKKSYDEGYTVQDKTIDNIIYVITNYYDEAYEYAYDYAEKEGYIEKATAAIDDVITEVEAIREAVKADTDMTSAFKGELLTEIDKVVATLESAKALLKEADVLDQATLDALMDLLHEAGDDIQYIYDLAEQAAIDVNQLVIIPQLKEAHKILINEVLPEIDRQLQIAVKEGTEWLMKKAREAYDEFVEWLVDEALPGTDKALYDWLYENPDKVIAFFNEYGDDMGSFIVEYHKEIGAVLGYIAYEFGDDVLEYVLNNPEEALDKFVKWYDKYGERTWAMIECYLDELGITDAIEGVIEDIKDPEKFKDMIGEIYKAVEQYGPEVLDAVYKYAEENGYTEILEDAIGNIEAGIDKVKEQIAAAEAAYVDSTTLTYEVSEDSYYVGLGDSTAYAVKYRGKTVTPYVERLADELGLTKEQYANLSKEGMSAEEMFAVIEENKAEIEKADLITLSLGNGEIIKFVMNQILKDPVDLDWSNYVDKAGVKQIENALTEIEAYLLESMDEETAEMMTFALESYAYAYVDLACNYPEAVNAIHEINPDAQVIIVGMYNPLAGTTFTINSQELPVGEYVDSIVELSNLHYLTYAVLTDNTIYVEAPAVENNVEAGEMGTVQMLRLLLAPKAMYPTNDGHEYIKEQILGIMDVRRTVLWGDADSSGAVDVDDAQLVLEYYAGLVDEADIELAVSDVDSSGAVDVDDAQLILELYAGLLDKFPVEK